MTIFLIFATLLLFLFCRISYGLLPYPTGLVLVSLFCEGFIYLLSDDIIAFSMADVVNFGGTRRNELATVVAFSLVSLVATLSYIGFSRNYGAVSASVAEFIGNRAILETNLSYLSKISFAHLALYLGFTDWSAFWCGSYYLEGTYNSRLADYDVLGFGSTAFRLSPMFLVITSLSFGLAIVLGRRIYSVVLGGVALFYYLAALSQHSRSAAFTPLLLAAVLYSFGNRQSRLFGAGFLGVAALSISIAVYGRGTSYQGICALPDDLGVVFTDGSPWSELAGQIAQGAVVFAEALQLNPAFSIRYTLLSFSPFPTFIDGFQSVLFTDQVRLHDYVPMSGLAELFFFGLPFIIAAVLVVVCAARLTMMVSRQNKMIFILNNFLLTLGVYGCFCYPLRTGFRFVWLSITLSIGSILFIRRASARRKPLSSHRGVAVGGTGARSGQIAH